MPFIEVLDLSEDDVVAVSDYMKSLDLKPDEDFVELHNTEWVVTGVRLLTPPAMQALAHLA